MKLIVGLGNLGLKYCNTRHNIGFKVVKTLAKKHNIKISQLKAGARTGTGLINNQKFILAMPQRFMNLSGGPVSTLIALKRVKISDALIVCDDVNLLLGSLRLRPSGSAGGHNGLKSIISCLGRDDFSRLRIGVGIKGLKGDITDFVLGEFNSKEKILLPQILANAVSACEGWISGIFRRNSWQIMKG